MTAPQSATRAREVAILRDDAAIENQRVASGIQMVLPLRGGRIVQERGRLDRIAGRRLLQRVLGRLVLVLLQQRPPVKVNTSLPAFVLDGGTLERLPRLAQERAVVARTLEPDLSQRAIDLRFVRIALERIAEREHREIPVPGARVREADGDLTFDVIPIEPRQQLQLLQLVSAPAERRNTSASSSRAAIRPGESATAFSSAGSASAIRRFSRRQIPSR